MSISYGEPDLVQQNANALAAHWDKALYATSDGKIRWHSKWNLLGRLIEFIKDPFNTKINRVFRDTLVEMIAIAERKKEAAYVTIPHDSFEKLTDKKIAVYVQTSSGMQENDITVTHAELIELLWAKGLKYLTPENDASPILILHNATVELRKQGRIKTQHWSEIKDLA